MEENIERDSISIYKGMAMILVVLGHAMTPTIRATNTPYQVAWDVIYSFHMFAFFAVSGWLFEKSIQKYLQNRNRFIKNKFRHLIQPYIVLTCLEYGLIWCAYSFAFGKKVFGSVGISNYSFADFVKALLLDINHFDIHLWFVYVLFFIFIINIVFPRFSIKQEYFGLLLICGFMYSVLSYLNIRINAVLYWAIPFFLGRVAYKNRWAEKIKELKRLELGGVVFLFIFANAIYMQLNKMQGDNLFVMEHIRVGTACILRHIAGLFGTLVLAWGCFQIKSPPCRKLLKKIGEESYGIYLFHQPFLTTGVATVGMKLGIPSAIVIFAATILGIVVPILFCESIIKRNRILSVLFPI